MFEVDGCFGDPDGKSRDTRLRMHLIKCFTTVDIQVKFAKVGGFWVKDNALIKCSNYVKRCTENLTFR